MVSGLERALRLPVRKYVQDAVVLSNGRREDVDSMRGKPGALAILLAALASSVLNAGIGMSRHDNEH